MRTMVLWLLFIALMIQNYGFSNPFENIDAKIPERCQSVFVVFEWFLFIID